jgi:Pyridoxamine 5'-phosphate oxidase
MPKTATADRVERDALLEFLRPRHQAVLVTRRREGGVQMSPVSCGVDAAGRIVVSTYPQRAKVANARRDPAVSLCVLSEDWNGPWRKDPRAPHRSRAGTTERGAPRLGRVPRGHDPAGQVAAADHPHRVGFPAEVIDKL